MSYTKRLKNTTSDAFIDGSKYIKLHKKGRQSTPYKLNKKLDSIDNDEIDIIEYPNERIIGVDKQRTMISDYTFSLGKRRG